MNSPLHNLSQPTPGLATASLLAVTAVWGVTFVAIKSALADIGPLWFIATRFSLAAVVLLLIYPRRTLNSLRKTGRAGGIIGIALFAGFLLQTLGLQYTSATNSAFITGLSVVLVPIVGRFWGQKSPSVAAWLGIVSAAAGLGLLTVNEAITLNSGDMLTVFAALALALHIVLVGHHAVNHDAIALSVLQILVVAAGGLGSALMFEAPPAEFSREVWFALGVTAIPATAIAILIQNAMQRYTTPARAAVIFAAEPVFAGLFAFLALGETLGLQQWVGCLFIIAGMLLSDPN